MLEVRIFSDWMNSWLRIGKTFQPDELDKAIEYAEEVEYSFSRRVIVNKVQENELALVYPLWTSWGEG